MNHPTSKLPHYSLSSGNKVNNVDGIAYEARQLPLEAILPSWSIEEDAKFS